MKPLSLLILVLALVGAAGTARKEEPPQQAEAVRVELPRTQVRLVQPVDVTTTPLAGTATWYCSKSSACTRGYHPSDMVAAIDPSLGIPKGTLLTVSHGGRSIVVKVVDLCLCQGRRLIDLTSGAFSRLSLLSAGVISVTIEAASLPATDTAP